MKTLSQYITEYLIKKKVDKVRGNSGDKEKIKATIAKCFGMHQDKNTAYKYVDEWVDKNDVNEVEFIATKFCLDVPCSNLNPEYKKLFYTDNNKVKECFDSIESTGVQKYKSGAIIVYYNESIIACCSDSKHHKRMTLYVRKIY